MHISEISNNYVKDINSYLKEQDKVKVKVLSIDPDGKISLSIKQAQPKRVVPKIPTNGVIRIKIKTRLCPLRISCQNF